MTTLLGSASTRRSLAVFVDQGLSSASNFLLVILVARTLSTGDFGTFAIAFSCLAVGLGLSRANVGVPLSIDLPGERDARTVSDVIARSMTVGVATGVLLGVVVAGIAVLLADNDELRATLLVLACASPLLVAQDVARYVAVAQGVPLRAVLSDGLWVLVGTVVLVASQVEGRQSSVVAAGGWVAGAVIGLIALRSCVRPPVWTGTGRWFAADRRRHHLTLDSITSSAAPLLVVTLVATIVSPTVVGTLRGASTLMSPINVAVAAVGLGAVAEIRRRTWPQAKRLMVVVSLGLAACALAWGLVVWLLPDSVGQFLLGDTWSSAKDVLPFTTAEFVGLSIWSGAIALLRASGRTRDSASFRIYYLVLAVVTATIAAYATSTADGVQLGLAASAALIAAATWVRVVRHHPQEDATRSPVGTVP